MSKRKQEDIDFKQRSNSNLAVTEEVSDLLDHSVRTATPGLHSGIPESAHEDDKSIPPFKKLKPDIELDLDKAKESNPGKKEKLHKVDSRRLDSLARLLQGSGTCAAAAFDGEKIILASNVLHYTSEGDKGKNQNQDLMIYVMSFLSQIANNDFSDKPVEQAKSTEDLLKKVAKIYIGSNAILANTNFKDEIDNLVHYSYENAVDGKWKDLTTLNDKEKAEAAGIKKIKQSHGGLLGHAPMAINRLQKDLNNIVQDIEKLKAAEKSSLISDIDLNLLKAFKQSNNHLDVRKKHGPNKDTTEYEEIVKDSNLTEVKSSESEELTIKVNNLDRDKEGNKSFNSKKKQFEKDLDAQRKSDISSNKLEYGYELLHINGQQGKGVHAEMQIAQRLIDKLEKRKHNPSNSDETTKDKSNVPQASNIYVGISMLCCLNCHAAIEAINEVSANKSSSMEMQHATSVKGRHYDSPVVQTIVASSDGEASIDLNTKSYLTLARRGNHNQDFEKNWSSPHYIIRKNNLDNSLSDYKAAYERVLKTLSDQVPSATMYMSDTEVSNSQEIDEEKNIGKEEKSKQKLAQDVIINSAKDIQDPKILEQVIKQLQEELEQKKQQEKTKDDKGSKGLAKEQLNAFNQYANKTYEYSETDIISISKQTQKKIAEENPDSGKIIFRGVQGGTTEEKRDLTKELIRNYVNAHIKGKAADEQKPLIAIYNVNGNHWVSYAVEPKADGSITISYKDSKGHERSEIKDIVEQTVKEALGETQSTITVRQLDKGVEDQLDGVSCGVFALKNMEIMADTLIDGKDLSELEAKGDHASEFYNSDHNGIQDEHDKAVMVGREEYALVFARDKKEEVVASLIELEARPKLLDKLNEQSHTHIVNLREKLDPVGNIADLEIVTTSLEDKEKFGAYSYKVKFEISDTSYERLESIKSKLVKLIGGSSDLDYDFVTNRDNKENKNYLTVKIANRLIEQPGKLEARNNIKLPDVTDEIHIDNEKVNKETIDALGAEYTELSDSLATKLKDEVGIDTIAHKANQLIEPFEKLIDKNIIPKKNIDILLQRILESKNIEFNEFKIAVEKFIERNQKNFKNTDILNSIIEQNDNEEVKFKPNGIELFQRLLLLYNDRKVEKEQAAAYEADRSGSDRSPGNSIDSNSPQHYDIPSPDDNKFNNLTHSEKYKQDANILHITSSVSDNKVVDSKADTGASSEVINKDYEQKLNLKAMLTIGNVKSILTNLELYAKIELEKKFTSNGFSNYSDSGKTNNSVNIVSEENHVIDHKANVKEIRNAIKEGRVNDNVVICLERKEKGENFGMSDVILLSNILKYNSKPDTQEKIVISDEIKSLPIYADALLYKTARRNGISVTAVEGKDMDNDKNREEYMANKVAKMAASGKEVILLIGSNHSNNIANFLKDKQIINNVNSDVKETLDKITSTSKNVSKESNQSTSISSINNISLNKPKGRSI